MSKRKRNLPVNLYLKKRT
nr:unnamed protein product [Callosobruchus analis]